MRKERAKSPRKGPGFYETDMFDVYSRGNYMGSVGTRKDLKILAEELLRKLGPEGFEKKRLTAIPSMHFHAKSQKGRNFSRTLSQP